MSKIIKYLVFLTLVFLVIVFTFFTFKDLKDKFQEFKILVKKENPTNDSNIEDSLNKIIDNTNLSEPNIKVDYTDDENVNINYKLDLIVDYVEYLNNISRIELLIAQNKYEEAEKFIDQIIEFDYSSDKNEKFLELKKILKNNHNNISEIVFPSSILSSWLKGIIKVEKIKDSDNENILSNANQIIEELKNYYYSSESINKFIGNKK